MFLDVYTRLVIQKHNISQYLFSNTLLGSSLCNDWLFSGSSPLFMDLLICVNDKYSSFGSSQYDRDDFLSLFLSAEQLSSMIFLKASILFNWVRQCWAPIISLGWYFFTGYAFPGFYLLVLNPILLCLVIEIQSCYTMLSSFCYERVLV